jgi:hypothetical protein
MRSEGVPSQSIRGTAVAATVFSGEYLGQQMLCEAG